MSDKRTKKTPYRLCWGEYGTAEDLINKLEPLISGPVSTMMELEGDMYLSDWAKLKEAFYLLNNKDD